MKTSHARVANVRRARVTLVLDDGSVHRFRIDRPTGHVEVAEDEIDVSTFGFTGSVVGGEIVTVEISGPLVSSRVQLGPES